MKLDKDKPQRVLVCGGRDFGSVPFNKYNDPDHWIKAEKEQTKLTETLDFLYTKCAIETVIHGGARGADKLSGMWAKNNSIPVEVYKADWDTYGKRAGILRNAEMLSLGKPSLVIAFKGGIGTRDMVRRSKEAGIPVIEVK